MQVLQRLDLGDVEGHPFHGNQWTDGSGYRPDSTAPEKGEFVMGPDPSGLYPKGIAVGWRQEHKSLVADAMHSWKGDPIDMSIHMKLVHDGVPPNGGSFKQNAQAAALLWEMEHNARPNTQTLYRGSHERPTGFQAFSESRAVANRWQRMGKGEVFTLRKGEGRGLRIADYASSGLDQVEREWIIDADRQPVTAAGDLPGHPFRGNQWTQNSLDSHAEGFAADFGTVKSYDADGAEAKLYEMDDLRESMPDNWWHDQGTVLTRAALAEATEGSSVLVAEQEDTGISGALSYHFASPDMGESFRDAMHVDFLGTTGFADGAGSALVKEAAKLAADRGVGMVGEPLLEAVPFWEKVGWHEDPEGIGESVWGWTAEETKAAAK